MDLKQLSKRTKITSRRLRYILDQKLVPTAEIKIAVSEVGQPRQFSDRVAFLIVCAARMIDLGLPPRIVQRFLGRLPDKIHYPPVGSDVACFSEDECCIASSSKWFTEFWTNDKRPKVHVRLEIGRIWSQLHE